jgi:hypothetical protein
MFNRSSIPEARARLLSDMLFLFDAVPFWLSLDPMRVCWTYERTIRSPEGDKNNAEAIEFA